MEFIVPDINPDQYSSKTEIETSFGHCRCCLEEGHHRDITKLYLSDGKQENYSDIFLDCFNIFLSTNTNLSTLICTSCVCRLRDAKDFKSQVMRMEHQLMKALYDCRGEQMVLVNVPVAEDSLDTTVGFKINVNDVEDTKPCNLADKMFVIEESKPEVPVAEDSLDTTVGFKINMNDVEDTKPCNLADKMFVIEENEPEVHQEIPNEPIEIKHEKLNETPPILILTEKTALMNNICTLLNHCNATLFKSKTKAGFPCFYCCTIFNNFVVLREHQKEHPRYSLKSVLDKYTADNLVIHADVTDLKCTLCDKDMKSLNELKSHLMDAHEMAFHSKCTDRVVPFKFMKSNCFECQICMFNFETYRTVERHMNTHFRNYVCHDCGAGFVTNTRLRVHLRAIHKEGSFPCEVCSKMFITHSKYKCHVDFVHKMIKKLKCHTCSERFSDYYVMKKHMVDVHKEKPILYKCNVCFKSFSRMYNLACHMLRHLKQKDISCEKCEYKCYTKYELKKHMLRHSKASKVGQHRCSICGRSYLRKCTLVYHMKTHRSTTTEQ